MLAKRQFREAPDQPASILTRAQRLQACAVPAGMLEKGVSVRI